LPSLTHQRRKSKQEPQTKRETVADTTAESRIVKAILHGEYSAFPEPLKALIEFAPLGFESSECGAIVAAYRAARSNGGNISAYLDGDHAAFLEIYQTSIEAEPPAAVAGDAKRLLNRASKQRLTMAMGTIEAQPSSAFDVLQGLNKSTAEQKTYIEEVWTIRDLANFDFSNDDSGVIGVRDGKTTRFLCRGYPAWLIGMAGIGKSSLHAQFAVNWGINMPCFGITPVKACRILIIQAENDRGDAAEMIQGVLSSMGIDEFSNPELFELCNQNIVILTERYTTGPAFCEWLHKKIQWHKADIVFVDPFLSFAGIEVSRQKECTELLRHHLNPILHETGCVLFATHHTGKPKSNKMDRKGWTVFDYAYEGIGSSELINWARAAMVLLPIDERHFELKLAKRGWRAGAIHPATNDGNCEPTTSVFLRHSVGKIFWEQIPPPEGIEEQASDEPKEKPLSVPKQIAQKLNTASFLDACPAGGEGLRQIVRRLRNWLTSKECKPPMPVSEGTGNNAIKEMVINEKLTLINDTYTRGLNA